MGIFDQDVDDEYSLKYAKLYMPGQYNLFFNMRIFIYSVLHGIIRFAYHILFESRAKFQLNAFIRYVIEKFRSKPKCCSE